MDFLWYFKIVSWHVCLNHFWHLEIILLLSFFNEFTSLIYRVLIWLLLANYAGVYAWCAFHCLHSQHSPPVWFIHHHHHYQIFSTCGLNFFAFCISFVSFAFRTLVSTEIMWMWLCVLIPYWFYCPFIQFSFTVWSCDLDYLINGNELSSEEKSLFCIVFSDTDDSFVGIYFFS